MDLRCRLGFHKWTSTKDLKEGSIRICYRCAREEIYICFIDERCKWYECLDSYPILQGEMIDV